MQIVVIQRLPCLIQSIKQGRFDLFFIANHVLNIRIDFVDMFFEEKPKMLNWVYIWTIWRLFHDVYTVFAKSQRHCFGRMYGGVVLHENKA